MEWGEGLVKRFQNYVRGGKYLPTIKDRVNLKRWLTHDQFISLTESSYTYILIFDTTEHINEADYSKQNKLDVIKSAIQRVHEDSYTLCIHEVEEGWRESFQVYCNPLAKESDRLLSVFEGPDEARPIEEGRTVLEEPVKSKMYYLIRQPCIDPRNRYSEFQRGIFRHANRLGNLEYWGDVQELTSVLEETCSSIDIKC